MVDISTAIIQLLIVLILTVVGYLAQKLRWLNEAGVATINGILLNIALPCMIVSASAETKLADAAELIPLTFLLAFVQYFTLLGTGALSNLVMRTPKEQRGLYLFMATVINNGFVGIPLVAAIYGDSTIIFSSIFVIITNVMMTSLGFWILSRPTPGTDETSLPRRRLSLRDFLSMPLIASVVALVLLFTQVELPFVAQRCLDVLGGLCLPLALIVVGALIARSDLKSVAGEWRMYGFILIRQLLIPLLLFFILRQLGVNDLLIDVFVVLFAMPVGSMVPTFASMFHRDAHLGAVGTVLSTICSFITIPILIIVMAFVMG